MRAIATLSDKLLGLMVPRVTARAEPCGPLVQKYCYCGTYAGKSYAWMKKCCLFSGSCYPCVRQASPGC